MYQSLDDSSPMRFHVYLHLVQLAGQTNRIDTIFKDVETVKSQFTRNPPSNEQMQKLFNEIEAEFKCKIIEILKDDATPVEYGEGLFLVERL